MTSAAAPALAPASATLTRTQERALALTIAVVTANAYYIHPIIGDVARGFGVGEATIGLVPALNQLALALGILLLLPLGDYVSNRKLCLIFVAAQTACLGGMVIAPGFASFTAASTLLGFVTIAPYLIPAFASKRVAPERLGQVTAQLTAAVIFGILVARVGAGIIAARADWHTVYVCAFVLMAGVTAYLPFAMRSEAAGPKRPQAGYGALIASVFTLAARHPDMRLSAAIQGLNFGIFTATWLALALHLTGPEMGYGTDDVGYLAGVAAISIATTPRLGRWADRIGPHRARLASAVVQFAGIALFYPLGGASGGAGAAPHRQHGRADDRRHRPHDDVRPRARDPHAAHHQLYRRHVRGRRGRQRLGHGGVRVGRMGRDLRAADRTVGRHRRAVPSRGAAPEACRGGVMVTPARFERAALRLGI